MGIRREALQQHCQVAETTHHVTYCCTGLSSLSQVNFKRYTISADLKQDSFWKAVSVSRQHFGSLTKRGERGCFDCDKQRDACDNPVEPTYILNVALPTDPAANFPFFFLSR